MGQVAKKKTVRAAPAKAARPAAKSIKAASAEARPHQQEVMHRLRRVEGQIRGILTMMEEGQACDAIAQQLSAARKALDRAFYEMLACRLEMEVTSAPSGSVVSDRIASMTRLLAKYA